MRVLLTGPIMVVLTATILTAGLVAAALPASAQDEGETPADDIVVTGVPLREGEETPVTLQDDGLSAVVSRQIASEVDRFARCADLPRPDLLRRIVDGKPESGEAQRALEEARAREKQAGQPCEGL